MAVFRIEKTRDFTVMSNHHLKNKTLSLRAKGLLSLMLSLPEEWDYSMSGLEKLSAEGITAVRTAIRELEAAGYVERRRLRNSKGQLEDAEYIIHEQPISVKPILENPTLENPTLENPIQEKPMQENRRQLNTNILNTKELNTDLIKYPSINNPEPEETAAAVKSADTEDCQYVCCANADLRSSAPLGGTRWIDRYNKTHSEVKKQIEYDSLILTNNAELVNDIVNVMTEVLIIDTPYYIIEGKQIPTELVRINYRKITYGRLDAFLLDFSRFYTEIKNPKKYLITALYNIASTAETSITNRVNHDLYGR